MNNNKTIFLVGMIIGVIIIVSIIGLSKENQDRFIVPDMYLKAMEYSIDECNLTFSGSKNVIGDITLIINGYSDFALVVKRFNEYIIDNNLKISSRVKIAFVDSKEYPEEYVYYTNYIGENDIHSYVDVMCVVKTSDNILDLGSDYTYIKYLIFDTKETKVEEKETVLLKFIDLKYIKSDINNNDPIFESFKTYASTKFDGCIIE